MPTDLLAQRYTIIRSEGNPAELEVYKFNPSADDSSTQTDRNLLTPETRRWIDRIQPSK